MSDFGSMHCAICGSNWIGSCGYGSYSDLQERMNRACGCVAYKEARARWEKCPNHNIIVHWFKFNKPNYSTHDRADCTLCNVCAYGETLQEAADNLIEGKFDKIGQMTDKASALKIQRKLRIIDSNTK